jgi:hypothetical protein
MTASKHGTTIGRPDCFEFFQLRSVMCSAGLTFVRAADAALTSTGNRRKKKIAEGATK